MNAVCRSAAPKTLLLPLNMDVFYRQAIERFPNKAVTVVYEPEVHSRSSFVSSLRGFNIKFIFAHKTDISFDFLNINSNYQRQHVSSAQLPKRQDSAIFDEIASLDTVRIVILQKLRTLLIAPNLHQQMMDMALNIAYGYIKSKPPEHNSVVIDLFARVSLRFDFEEPIMPRFKEEYCRVFREYIPDLETCSICWDDFTDKSCRSVSTPCRHKFHRDCISRWLTKSRFCPNCRQGIKKAQLRL